MNKKKKNLIIIGAVIILGIATWIIANSGAKKATFEQDFHIKDIESVCKVFIADKQNQQVLLERTIDSLGDKELSIALATPLGLWTANMLPASLLSTFCWKPCTTCASVSK